MKKTLILIIIGILLNTFTISSAKEVSFTQDDRDRLIRLETKVEEGSKATNQRIDDLKDLVYMVLGGIIALIGFVIWDRRTALAPAVKRS